VSRGSSSTLLSIIGIIDIVLYKQCVMLDASLSFVFLSLPPLSK